MDLEVAALRAELATLERELQTARDEQRLKEEQSKAALESQKTKWTRKHAQLTQILKDLQTAHEGERKRYEGQMQTLSDRLVGLKEESSREEVEERRFLMQLDAELVAVAGRAKARLREESVNCESDTLQDSMYEEGPRPDGILRLISNIATARELLQTLLERSEREKTQVPAFTLSSSPALDLPKALSDSSLYSKALINDEILSSLTMSEREAVVYSIINAGSGLEQRRDVQLEDLLNITPEERKSVLLTSVRFEDLSSIAEEDDSGSPKDMLTLTLPEGRESDFSASRALNQAARLSLSPVFTPRSADMRIQSQSDGYSDMASQLEELDRGRIEDLSERKGVFDPLEMAKISLDLSNSSS